MIDFTSALYLDLRHPSDALPGWDALSSGRPAALREPAGADAVAAELARSQELPAATLLPSTLHLFWDLLRHLARQTRSAFLLDAGAYPTLHWAAEGARSLGSVARRFGHYSVGALATFAGRAAAGGLRPIVVCDAWCTGCNRPAPLPDYARIAADHGGLMVIDDTQALGLLGHTPTAHCPYGHGGGGSLRWHNLAGSGFAVGASLAKGMGAPVAVLAGSIPLIESFRRHSQTRMHCSPPSVAAVQAAGQALSVVDGMSGAARRARLLRLVRRLRELVVGAGLSAVGRMPFPVQSIVTPDSARLQRDLRSAGVNTLLTRGCQGGPPRLSLIVTARHSIEQVERAGRLLARHAYSVPSREEECT